MAKAKPNYDPFDPERLKVTDSTQLGVKRVQTVITCGKPGRQQFVRVHPDETYRMETALFVDEATRDNYLVDPSLWENLAGDIKRMYLFAAITKTENVFLWPVAVPDLDGRRNNWHLSLLRAAERAQHNWVRVQSNMADGQYDCFEATGDIPEPTWPDDSFRDMLQTCFDDRFITSLDHDILKRLRGEI